MDVEWVMVGDFNATAFPNERKRVSTINRNSKAIGFNYFLEALNLVDVPCKGNNYSWYIGDDKACSGIDRFLISEELI